LTGGFDFSGWGDCTSCPPIEWAAMSNSKPSAIVLHGTPCIGGLYKFRFEYVDRLHSNCARAIKPRECNSEWLPGPLIGLMGMAFGVQAGAWLLSKNIQSTNAYSAHIVDGLKHPQRHPKVQSASSEGCMKGACNEFSSAICTSHRMQINKVLRPQERYWFSFSRGVTSPALLPGSGTGGSQRTTESMRMEVKR
jgi:hypothetical protein